MIKLQSIAVMLCAFTLGTIGVTGTASAQKYATPADTVALNKEYGEVTLDIAKVIQPLPMPMSRLFLDVFKASFINSIVCECIWGAEIVVLQPIDYAYLKKK